jgi:hypothetical protein
MTAAPREQRAVAEGEGVVIAAPRRWLGVEALVLLAGALIVYGIVGERWWIVPAGLLVPDIAMSGYAPDTHGRTAIQRRARYCQPSCSESATGRPTT